MEHQVYRDQAQGVILDAYGKMVVEECKKFDEKTKQKIHDYIQQQVPLNPVEQLKQDGKLRLEHYQKFYENGTYERSRESGTEANYDMVDGLVNNQKKNPEKISDARSNKQTPRNQQDGNRKNNRRIHRMRFKRKKPHDHEEKWKQNTLANKVYGLKRESALLGLILCFAISNTTIKGQKLAFKQGVTEELKATDMMRWIGLMNNIRACADEIVLNDIVYS